MQQLLVAENISTIGLKHQIPMNKKDTYVNASIQKNINMIAAKMARQM